MKGPSFGAVLAALSVLVPSALANDIYVPALSTNASGSANSAAIAAALATARTTPNGPHRVILAPNSMSFGTREYEVSEPIALTAADNGVTLCGPFGPIVGGGGGFGGGGGSSSQTVGRDPATPDPLVTLRNTNAALSAMVFLSKCDAVTVCDIRLDGGVRDLRTAQAIYGLVMAGTEACTVENVSFENLGRYLDASGSRRIGGSQLLVLAAEDAGEFGAPGAAVSAIERFVFDANGQGLADRSATNNTVTQCRFLDSSTQPTASFGLRALTDYHRLDRFQLTSTNVLPLLNGSTDISEASLKTLGLLIDDYQYKIESNHFVGNSFVSGFYWSAVEIAGPATRANTIERNYINDSLQTPLEADKGASFNVFHNNTINKVQRNGGLGVPSGRPNLYAIRDQGIPPDLRSNGLVRPERYCIGNQFTMNTLRDVRGHNYESSGFFLRMSQLAVIEGNTLEAFVPPPNGQRTALFVMREGVFHSRLRSNTYRYQATPGVGPWIEIVDGRSEPPLGLTWLRHWGLAADAAGSNGRSEVFFPAKK